MTLQQIKKLSKQFKNITNHDLLIRIIFEKFRYFDKEFVDYLHQYQTSNDIVFNQEQRRQARDKFYLGKYFKFVGFSESFDSINFCSKDIDDVLNDLQKRVKKYDHDKIINSIINKLEAIESHKEDKNFKKWLQAYYKRNAKYDYSGAIIEINQEWFKSYNFDENKLFEIVNYLYEKIANYRHIVFHVSTRLVNRDGNDITWSLISHLIIYCENFKQFVGKYCAFKKENLEYKLEHFLKARSIKDANRISNQFYNGISTGFKFEDCLVDETNTNCVLVMKKIVLDNTPIPCPSCMSIIQSGNSFPEMFLKSYECKNLFCSDRSKSGRGKRFNEYGVYRYFKLCENDERNKISNKLYMQWHRDIFKKTNDINEMILKYYFWADEKIAVINKKIRNAFGRKLILVNKYLAKQYVQFNELPILKLLKSVLNKHKVLSIKKIKIKEQIKIINADSTSAILSIPQNTVGAAITSPPYYNAREYSQWDNLIFYLIDMMLNALSVIQTLKTNGYYLYNIGDVVSQDNVYVQSHMSLRRIPLGPLSVLIFELVGFNLTGNIIWDKGAVQSKRNSTINMNTGYIKFINCYEHVYVFKKGSENKGNSSIVKITPVIKINNKGINTYKHTAPYPIELVSLIRPFADQKMYILDPFLGSGTTVIWCKKNGFKGIGFELNTEYYKLCLDKLKKL